LINCRTGFYLVRGKLGLFFTLAKKSCSSRGVEIGTSTARAERLLHHKVYLGAHCGPGLELGSKTATLAIFFSGGNRTSSTRARSSSVDTWTPSTSTARIAIPA
jgi:hypothetical protein